jgi:hypothetical protein
VQEQLYQQHQQTLQHQQATPTGDSEEEEEVGRQYSEAGPSPSPYGEWCFFLCAPALHSCSVPFGYPWQVLLSVS